MSNPPANPLPLPTAPDPNDLTSVDNVKSFLANIQSTAENTLLQLIVTWASRLFLVNLCGLEPTAAGNVLNSVLAFTETRDGSGSARLFLRHRPIVSVTSLKINGRTIPQSTAYGVGGWMIADDKLSLILRPGSSSGIATQGPLGSGWIFSGGIANNEIAYTAGYSVVPADVQGAVLQMASIFYKRRQWIDERSRVMPASGGTINFRDWMAPPEVHAVAMNYKRVAAW